ncbi:MAG: 16S rRNA (cytosine(1402)-N(4))-methyltransferase RsmH [Syntrophobacteraceae bacterium]|nr:16S rRNA (cytosine(1402)-N(4))-methyltransferase RsmH [Syntrophobacteraceae bacterium]
MESRPTQAHVPVMLDEVLRWLGCRAGGLYVDGTVGGGGYAEAILEASAPGGRLIALDWDAEAVDRVKHRLSSYRDRVIVERGSFAELPVVLARHETGPVDGIVLDLGVSSFQLSDPCRGFSFVHDGPLDMRMDQSLPRTAADLVNTLPENDLADLIFRLGEEKWSRRIARAVVSRRIERPFRRTAELADLISYTVPRTRDSRRIHPATRTFQALRIAVNRELETLEVFLTDVLDALKPGGRLCIVAFHSLEDRIIKHRFRDWAKSCRCPANAPVCKCQGRPLVKLLTRKAVRPGEEEVGANPRARSARLRAVEKQSP